MKKTERRKKEEAKEGEGGMVVEIQSVMEIGGDGKGEGETVLRPPIL